MTLKSRYAKFSKISEYKFRQITKLFACDLTATQIAQIAGLNCNTVNKYLTAIRQRIAEFCEFESPFRGEVEVDESFFGAKRIKGKEAAAPMAKPLCSGFLDAMGKYILR